MTAQYDPIHPGEILKEEFLGRLGVSAAELLRLNRQLRFDLSTAADAGGLWDDLAPFVA